MQRNYWNQELCAHASMFNCVSASMNVALDVNVSSVNMSVLFIYVL